MPSRISSAIRFRALAPFAAIMLCIVGCQSPSLLEAQLSSSPSETATKDRAPRSRFAAAIERTRARLYSDPRSDASEVATRATEDFLSGLIESAWRISHAARYVSAPRFAAGSGVVGLPGLFNPDNLYRSALLDPDGSYRISGTRGSHALLSFQFLDAYPLVALTKGLEVIDLDQLGVRPGEKFVLQIGGEKTTRVGERWWPMPEGARAILARQTFNDWANETPTTIRIDRLGAPRSLPIDDESHADLAADYLDRMTALWADGYLAQLQKLPVNVFPPIRASGEEAGGLAGQQGVITRYALKEDEALIVSVRASDAAYQSIQLGNHWFATQNPLQHQSSLNQTQAAPGSADVLQFVISHRDPGVANWLATAGAEHGYIMIRWQGIQTPLTKQDQPRALRVPITELAMHLEPRAERVAPDERRKRLSARSHLPALKQ